MHQHVLLLNVLPIAADATVIVVWELSTPADSVVLPTEVCAQVFPAIASTRARNPKSVLNRFISFSFLSDCCFQYESVSKSFQCLQ